MSQQFKFWKDNLLTNEFSLTEEELRTKFLDWLKYQDNEHPDRGRSWIEYYYGYSLIYCFEGDREDVKGLQSVGETKQADELCEMLANVYRTYVANN